MSLDFSAQCRLHFDAAQLREVGVTRILASPFQVNSECFQSVEAFKENVRFVKEKVQGIHQQWPQAKVAIIMFTICHPEGNFCLPDRFRPQLDIEGRVRPGFICFRDEQRQSELLEMYRIIAEEGFEYVMIDDDFRDALCFCDRHLEAFKPFAKTTRKELTASFNNKRPSAAEVKLKRQWLDFRRQGLVEFAGKIEKALHSINPSLRIGICISAKRLNDLSGRSLREWLELFDTPAAPVFVRLAGEHYDDRSLGISRSVGWHQYYRELLPDDMEMMAEVTYVHSVCHKGPAGMRLETRIHLAGGLSVLFAWTDDYRYNGGWNMLRHQKRPFEIIKEKSKEFRNSVGLTVYAPENCAEYVPFDQVAAAEPIKAWQGLGLMGFPVKLGSRLDITHKVTLLTGCLPASLETDIEPYLRAGGILVIDALAARAVKEMLPPEAVRYEIGDPISGLRLEKVIVDGTAIDELAGFPPASVYCMEIRKGHEDEAEAITEIYDVDGERRGLGALTYPVGKGWIIVLAYDLCAVADRICSPAYRRLLSAILARVGYEPEVELSRDLFVQPLLFEYPRNRLIAVNYNSYEAQVTCRGKWLDDRSLTDVLTGDEVNPEDIGIAPLDIRILEFDPA